MRVNQLLLLILLFVTFNSCIEKKKWTEKGAIPNSFRGTYKLVEGYEDYRIKITSTHIYNLTPNYSGGDLFVSEGKKFYVADTWNKKKFYQPAIICTNENCDEYIQIYFRIADGVLLIRGCYPDYSGDIICNSALKFLRLQTN